MPWLLLNEPRLLPVALPLAIKGKCDREEPRLVEKKPGHFVACWLY
jgi:hypothetical protein